MVQVVSGGILHVVVAHVFPTKEALGEDFKYMWVIVNHNSPMPFMSDITNEENE